MLYLKQSWRLLRRVLRLVATRFCRMTIKTFRGTVQSTTRHNRIMASRRESGRAGGISPIAQAEVTESLGKSAASHGSKKDRIGLVQSYRASTLEAALSLSGTTIDGNKPPSPHGFNSFPLSDYPPIISTGISRSPAPSLL